MGKDKNTYVTKTILIHDELSELDFTLHDEFKFDYEDLNANFIEIDVMGKKQERDFYANTTPLNISDLEKLITKFKKKGATHIQMFHHGDHHGYEFSGVKIEKASQKYIDLYKDEHKKKDKINKKYVLLKGEMAKLETEYQKLKV